MAKGRTRNAREDKKDKKATGLLVRLCGTAVVSGGSDAVSWGWICTKHTDTQTHTKVQGHTRKANRLCVCVRKWRRLVNVVGVRAHARTSMVITHVR